MDTELCDLIRAIQRATWGHLDTQPSGIAWETDNPLYEDWLRARRLLGQMSLVVSVLMGEDARASEPDPNNPNDTREIPSV